MKFSEHILIERTLEDVEVELLEEGLRDVTNNIKSYVTAMKALGGKVKSRFKIYS
jgi:hypothetical protein